MSITLDPIDYLYLAIILIIAVVIIVWLIRRNRGEEIDTSIVAHVARQWQEIESLTAQNAPSAWKVAIMEADKLLDYALKSFGFPGQDLGERLRAASYRFPNINNVWPAHKTRNRLVHETYYQLDNRTAKEAINLFKKTLQLLRVLK